jgi:hypothetical protein
MKCLVLGILLFAFSDAVTFASTPLQTEEILQKDEKMPSPSLSRVPPPEIETVYVDGTGYYLDAFRDEAFTMSTTYLLAVDTNNEEMWRTPIYTINYDKHLETDVQDVYPVSLDYNRDSHSFVIENEDGDIFTLELSTLALQKTASL